MQRLRAMVVLESYEKCTATEGKKKLNFEAARIHLVKTPASCRSRGFKSHT
jgi:hypothetical protein